MKYLKINTKYISTNNNNNFYDLEPIYESFLIALLDKKKHKKRKVSHSHRQVPVGIIPILKLIKQTVRNKHNITQTLIRNKHTNIICLKASHVAEIKRVLLSPTPKIKFP